MKNLFIIILLFISLCLMAQNVPQTIDYQGRLADNDGNYLNQEVVMYFIIYDVESGGTPLWGEAQNVTTVNGTFHVLLGSAVAFPSTLFDGAERWLELVVEGEYLSPRTQLASVPFAIKAHTVDVPLNLSGNEDNSVISAENTGWGYGIYGSSLGPTTTSIGIFGSHVDGNYGYLGSYYKGVYGYNNKWNGHAVYGLYSDGNYGFLGSQDYGVYGYYSNGNYGWLGSSSSGVYGRNNASNGYGVYGYNTSITGKGVWGNSTGGSGGYFTSSYPGSQARALHAQTTSVGYFDATAVYGHGRPAEAYGFGGYFIGGYKGVYGYVVAVSNSYYYGVSGRASGGYGTNYGVHGWADGTNSTNYAGYFSGNVHVSGTFTNPSDERFKENVQPFNNALSKIKLMNVHTYNYKKIAEEKQLVLPEGEQIGLIAQELEEILPELVEDIVHAYDKNENIENAERDMEKFEYKGINYIGLIPVLIEAIKELQIINEEHQQQLEEQQRQIDELLRSAGNR